MKKHNLREKSRLLVEHVLNKEFLAANSVLEKLIAEAEEDRENEVSEEFGFDSEEGGEETPNDGGDDTQLDSSSEESSEEGISDKDVDKVVDDTIEITCQINAKIIAKLFDKISALKQALDNADLDQDSREFIKFDTSITYYSDKLQDLQGKTNPGVDQSKVEEALNKIDTSLDQLKGELGGSSDENTADVASPEEIDSANSEDSESKEEETDTAEEKADESSDENKEEAKEKPAEEENKEESSEEGGDENFDDLFA